MRTSYATRRPHRVVPAGTRVLVLLLVCGTITINGPHSMTAPSMSFVHEEEVSSCHDVWFWRFVLLPGCRDGGGRGCR